MNIFCEEFSPTLYLSRIHRNCSLIQLQKGLENLSNTKEEYTKEIKALVKENLDRYFSCKDQVDDIPFNNIIFIFCLH